MDEKERILSESFNGYLVLEFDMGLHGIHCYNGSHMLGYTCREAEIEENTLDELAIRKKGRASWRARKREVFEDFLKNYEKFNLTKSGVTAFVKVNTSDPDKVTNRREFALKLLTHWIKSGAWQKETL